MASVLKAKNAEVRGSQQKYQWRAHCGARQRARNLKRLQAEALRAQRDGCDWLTVTQSVPSAPSNDGP